MMHSDIMLPVRASPQARRFVSYRILLTPHIPYFRAEFFVYFLTHDNANFVLKFLCKFQIPSLIGNTSYSYYSTIIFQFKLYNYFLIMCECIFKCLKLWAVHNFGIIIFSEIIIKVKMSSKERWQFSSNRMDELRSETIVLSGNSTLEVYVNRVSISCLNVQIRSKDGSLHQTQSPSFKTFFTLTYLI